MKSVADIALEIARKWHAGQMRKDGVTPYINHPMDVVRLLKSWGVADNETLAAAYAHDLLEDTEIPKRQLRELLGPNVLKRVEKLTHTDAIPKDEYLRKLAKDKDIWCAVIKAADRLCNTLDFIALGRYAYAKEYFGKAAPVFARLERDRAKLGGVYGHYYKDKAAVVKLLDLLNASPKRTAASTGCSRLRRLCDHIQLARRLSRGILNWMMRRRAKHRPLA